MTGAIPAAAAARGTLAFADEGEGDVRQRGEVAARPERPVLRDDRGDPGVEQLDDALDHDRANAEYPRASERARSSIIALHDLVLDRRSHPGGVGSDQRALQLLATLGRDHGGGERSEAGGHAVHRLRRSGVPLDDPRAGLHGRPRLVAELDPSAVAGHGDDGSAVEAERREDDTVVVHRCSITVVGAEAPAGAPRTRRARLRVPTTAIAESNGEHYSVAVRLARRKDLARVRTSLLRTLSAVLAVSLPRGRLSQRSALSAPSPGGHVADDHAGAHQPTRRGADHRCCTDDRRGSPPPWPVGWRRRRRHAALLPPSATLEQIEAAVTGAFGPTTDVTGELAPFVNAVPAGIPTPEGTVIEEVSVYYYPERRGCELLVLLVDDACSRRPCRRPIWLPSTNRRCLPPDYVKPRRLGAERGRTSDPPPHVERANAERRTRTRSPSSSSTRRPRARSSFVQLEIDYGLDPHGGSRSTPVGRQGRR